MRISVRMAKHFQYLVIGGGSGGIAGARRASEFGVSVGLVENKALGGTCVNVGCVPKKIMFYASEYASKLENFDGYGFDVQSNTFNFSKLKEKRDAYIKRLNGIYENNLKNSKVELIQGIARFSKDQGGEGDGRIIKVSVGDDIYIADHVLIATGGRPSTLDHIPGHELGVNSDGFFEMTTLPKKVVLVGAGYIAVELAGILKSLGSQVHLIIRKTKVLRSFDSLISDTITQNLIESGIDLITNSQVQKVEKVSNDGKLLKVHVDNGTVLGDVDKLIWAVGRVPNIDIGLENVGVKLDKRGYIEVDAFQNTSAKNIYALGDVCGKFLLTPVAIAAARRLSHRLFNNQTDLKLDYNNIPSVIFSHPPSGSVGLSQAEAEVIYGASNIKTYTSSFVPLHYSILTHKQKCHYKLICLLPNKKILGLHVVGESSDEILQGFAVAIKMGACKAHFDDTVAIHPTSAEELVTLR